MKLARPDLPKHHPQNVPLSQWTDGWLKMSCAHHLGVAFLMAHEHEKKERGWPVGKYAMIDFLDNLGDLPAAGL